MSGGATAAAKSASSAATPPSPTPAASGTSAPSATATSTSKKSSSPSTTSATRDRFPSNGKTPEWTANTAPKKRVNLCAKSTSSHRPSRSMRSLIGKGAEGGQCTTRIYSQRTIVPWGGRGSGGADLLS